MTDPDDVEVLPPPAPDLREAAKAHRKAMIISILMIALGAAVGANLRYGVSIWAGNMFGPSFPYGTLIINVLGSFVIGLVMAVHISRVPLSEPLRLLLVTGLLGGFTTFSSFSYESYTLMLRGQWLLALLYSAGSVALGLVAVVLAFGLVQLL